jgi:NAD(P)-dependent dehydrogenase (short-subunit alcohol dehydrogenase family)
VFSLSGKIALVTGAGSGIGASIAQVFAAAGAHVAIADIQVEAAKAALQTIANSGGSAECLTLDVADPKSAEEVAREIHEQHGRLDILVNNAGIGHVGAMLQTSAEDLDRLYSVNVRGVFNVTRSFLPRMLERKSGNIINIASIGGIVGIRDRLAYCATKFAVVGLTKSMALDHALEGIRVNCICPGRVETPFVSARLKEYPDPEKAYREMSATQALGRMAKPQEIAHAALYLASDESAFITGTAFLIDGGWSAGK